MNDKELSELMDLLYPYFIEKLKSDSVFKNCVRNTNATVSWVDQSTVLVDGVSQQVSNIGKKVKVRFPYDASDIEVINKSVSELSIGDLVCLQYYIDLKNAYVAYKV